MGPVPGERSRGPHGVGRRGTRGGADPEGESSSRREPPGGLVAGSRSQGASPGGPPEAGRQGAGGGPGRPVTEGWFQEASAGGLQGTDRQGPRRAENQSQDGGRRRPSRRGGPRADYREPGAGRRARSQKANCQLRGAGPEGRLPSGARAGRRARSLGPEAVAGGRLPGTVPKGAGPKGAVGAPQAQAPPRQRPTLRGRFRGSPSVGGEVSIDPWVLVGDGWRGAALGA